MIRAAFLRRMAFAALATALLEVRVPELQDVPADVPTLAPPQNYEEWLMRLSRQSDWDGYVAWENQQREGARP